MKHLPSLVIFFLLWASISKIQAQDVPDRELSPDSLDFDDRTNGKNTLSPLAVHQKIIQESTVVLFNKNTPIAYGCIMSQDGYILTKNSELPSDKSSLTLRLGRKLYSVTVLNKDEATDLVLLKIEGTDFTPLTWSSMPMHKGSLVISNASTTRNQRRIRLGILSTDPYPVEKKNTPSHKTFGETSERKSDFPLCVGHDIALHASQMGGPLLNLKGECIGLNIAKVNKSENLALPTIVVLRTYEALKKSSTQ